MSEHQPKPTQVATTTIHPTAIVDPGARIGAGVRIGPFCVIGELVEIGDGSVLENHVTIAGPTKVGKHNHFYPYCSIGHKSQDLKYTGEPTYLEVGDHNTVREFVTMNRATAPGTKTIVGSHNNFLAYSHVAHDCIVGNHTIFSNNGTIAGHVIVEDHAIISGLSAVHQFCRIGRFAITGGCSKIVQDVPPYMIADGNPAVVRGINLVALERHSFSREAVKGIKEAFRALYRAELNTKQAVEKIRLQLSGIPEVQQIISFIESSKRGVIR